MDASACISYNKPIHYPNSDLKISIDLFLKVNPNTTTKFDDSERDFAIVPYVTNGGVYLDVPSRPIPDAIGAINDIAGPFADVALVNASSPDTFVRLHLDGYEMGSDISGWIFVPRVADVYNNSSVTFQPMVGKVGNTSFNMGSLVQPGHNSRYLVPNDPAYVYYGDSLDLLITGRIFGEDPAGGLRGSMARIFYDSPSYLFRITFHQNSGDIEIDN